LEQKFHAHYFIGSNEKKLIDLTTLRQRNNEKPMEFLRRFRETKSMCFSLNIPDDQLAGMAVAGMFPAIREKLFGMEFDDLGQLSHRLSLMSSQAYGLKDRLGDQRGGSEWELIKILLEGDGNSDKMNPLGRTPEITRSALLPSVCQHHIATGVLLVLGTNSTSNLTTHAPTTAERPRKPANQRGAVRPGIGGG
jgi:hypothetical protein